MLQLVGFACEAQRSKQVVYRTGDGHIHELSFVLGGPPRWSHADLTDLTRAPPAPPGGFMGGFACEKQQSKQVVYRTGDGHIHELSLVLGGPNWSHNDLTDLTHAPPAIEGQFTAYAFEAQQSKQVVYRTGDGHIHELFFDVPLLRWSHNDLTALASAPPASLFDFIGGCASKAQQSKQVVYSTQDDGHIHALSLVLGSPNWSHNDLTALTGSEWAPHLRTAFACEAQRSKQVVYLDQFGGINELSVVLGGPGWSCAELTSVWRQNIQEWGKLSPKGNQPGGPDLAGFACEAQRSKQVVWMTGDGHIHELFLVLGGRGWSHDDLTDRTYAPPADRLEAAFAFEALQSKQVVYRTGNGHIHELFFDVPLLRWSHNDLTALTGAPPAGSPTT